jgi:hypothetical protein
MAVVIAVLGVATRSLRRVSAFYLLAGLGTFASVVWAFVIAPDAIDWQIGTSGNRVIMGTVFVALAGLLHVGGLLDGHRTVPATAELDAEPRAGEPSGPDALTERLRDTAPA